MDIWYTLYSLWLALTYYCPILYSPVFVCDFIYFLARLDCPTEERVSVNENEIYE
jgi:hypothetical protein